MSTLAAVIVGYDAKLRPSSVTCGLCGEELLKQGSPPPPERTFEQIVAQFILHNEEGHSLQEAATHYQETTGCRGCWLG
jgi:hypothetical protein